MEKVRGRRVRNRGLRSGEDNAACAQEANGKSKPDKHVGRLTGPRKKSLLPQASDATQAVAAAHSVAYGS